EQTQGAIGKRDVYHDQTAANAQPAAQTGQVVSAQAPRTDADIAKQAEEFNKLMAIGEFKSTLSNPRFKSLASNADFVKLIGNTSFLQLIGNANFAQAVASGALSSMLSAPASVANQNVAAVAQSASNSAVSTNTGVVT